jgi:hypothetical protein
MISPKRRRHSVVGTVLIIALLLGCQERRPITTHRIKLEPRDPATSNNTQQPTTNAPFINGAQSTTNDQPKRMVVAFIENDDATWFFKITGDPDQVEKHKPQWSAFINSITFDQSGQPQLNVPEGWTEGPKRMMVEKTFVIGDSANAVELAVSTLSTGQDLTLNVNRWLMQLGKQPIDESQLSTMIEPLKTDAGSMWYFDQSVGTENTASENKAVPDKVASDSENPVIEKPDAPFQYSMADSWQLGDINSVVILRFHKKDAQDENKMASISVSGLSPQNEWVPNVQRWCGEIGLEAFDQEKVESETRTIQISGMDAQRIDLVSPDSNQSTFAVMLVHDNIAWFFKLYGDSGMVADGNQDFDAFLESIKFD